MAKTTTKAATTKTAAEAPTKTATEATAKTATPETTLDTATSAKTAAEAAYLIFFFPTAKAVGIVASVSQNR